ncbi:hypothetical protein CIB48_g5668 [Xylaria polymorpha]|nr:hypothetical protein CIB48_g5668 [Xylaria polymorpha]
MASNGWERHKATILNLFLHENLQFRQVASYMKQTHNFDKSKSAYEKQLQDWGVKKHVPREAWRYIGHRINKRKREKKQSEIVWFGTLLPAQKVHRETQRYADIPSAIEFGKRLPSPEIPAGAIVRVQTPPIVEIDVVWPDTLPWFYFKNRVLPTRNEFPPCLVAEMLKAVFFHLSNHLSNYIPLVGYRFDHDFGDDKFVLHLVEAVSSTNPEMLKSLLSSKCTTTKAIKEVVYKAAVLERNYLLVEQLVKSGVDPDLPVGSVGGLVCRFEQEIVLLRWGWDLYTGVTGMLIAALTSDISLATILLDAGAGIKDSAELFMQAVICSRRSAVVPGNATKEQAVDFMLFLVKHGAIVDLPTQCSCGGTGASLFFAVAIDPNNPLSEFLIEKGATADLSGCLDARECRRSRKLWSSQVFDQLRIPYTPLHLAVVFKNHEIFDRLFESVLSSPIQTSLAVVKQLLIISCLVGDAFIASKLLKFSIDLNDGWELGITPLVASAWNQDTNIAEMLMGLGANVGPTKQDEAALTPAICPIHVAACHGNADLVRRLLDAGAGCEVNCNQSVGWLIKHNTPHMAQFPIQLAFKSQDVDTISLLLPISDLHGGECTQASKLGHLTLISDVISKQKRILSGHENGTVTLEDILITEDTALIQLYLSSGRAYTSQAFWMATKSAVTSGDHSLVELLAGYRPAGEIDSFEASSLVLSIAKCQWDLVYLLLSGPFLPGPSKSFCDRCGTEEQYRRLSFGSPNNSGFRSTPFLVALYSGNISLVEKMIQRGFKINSDDATSLFMDGELETPKILNTIRTAVWSNFPQHHMNARFWEEVLRSGIKSGDVMKVRKYSKMVQSLDFCTQIVFAHIQFAPLALAAKQGNIELVRVLLHAGANVNYSPDGGYTALQVAASEGHFDVVKFLINKGAVLNPPTPLETGATVLELAAGNGYLSIVRLLIEAGADINAPPALFNGRTALEIAAENGRLDTVQLLLGKGVKLEDEMRIYYVRSVGFAIREGHYAIADHLKQYGSWSTRDQRLHDRRYALHPNLCFRYNEELDDWYIQRIGRVYGFETNPVVGPSDLPSSDAFLKKELPSDEEFSSDEEGTAEEESISDYGVEGTEEIKDPYHETNYIPRTWQNGMALTHSELTDLNFSYEEGTSYAPTTAWTLGSNRVTELEDIPPTDDVAQQTTLLDTQEPDYEMPAAITGYGIANTSMQENYAVDRMEIWRPVLGSRQEVLDADTLDPDALYMDVTDWPTGLFDMNVEWEGPFTGIGDVT